MRHRAALIVLDDVWNAADVEPFRIESKRSRLLFTTRDLGLAANFGARTFTAALFSEGEAREVLARWADVTAEKLPPQATHVIDECKHLALALAIIGAQLRGKPVEYWDVVLSYLRSADLTRIRARFPEPHTSLVRAIDVSFEALQKEDAAIARHYLALAVLLEDMTAVPVIQQTLWNVDRATAFETANRLVELSLATRDPQTGGIQLHDLQLDYVRMRYASAEPLKSIHGAIRLSMHVIREHPSEFAAQLVGRLLEFSDPTIQQFRDEITAGAPVTWLRPMWPTLHPPGELLLRTMAGHRGPVSGVAVTLDGKRAVSASRDKTLKVWDLEEWARVKNTRWAFRSRQCRRAPTERKSGHFGFERSDLETMGPGEWPRPAYVQTSIVGHCTQRDSERQTSRVGVKRRSSESMGPGERLRGIHSSGRFQ